MITPKAMGTDVRLTIFTGESFVVPATIKITAATGEIARNRFPANCMGIDKAMGEIPAAFDRGNNRGIIA